MELRIEQKYTDRTKLINWLITTKELIKGNIWPVMEDPAMRDKSYDITADLLLRIEKHLSDIEEDL